MKRSRPRSSIMLRKMASKKSGIQTTSSKRSKTTGKRCGNVFEKIKTFAVALAGIVGALLAALFYREKAKRIETENKQLEAESEALSRVSEALIESEKTRDETIEHAKTKPVDRSHFGKPRKLH
jgi:hypothetical protein